MFTFISGDYSWVYSPTHWFCMKRQTSGATNHKEEQRVTTSGTTSDNEWYNKWQRVATNNSGWQVVVILVKLNFLEEYGLAMIIPKTKRLLYYARANCKQ